MSGFGGKKKKKAKKTDKEAAGKPMAVSAEDTGGLEPVLELGVGGRVMVRKNIDDARGLVNGAVGTITKLVMSADGRNLVTVFVRLEATKEEEQIVRVSNLFRTKKTSSDTYSRSQFPLIPAYAITVHKSQVLAGSSQSQVG